MNGISDLEGIVEAPGPDDADALTVVGLVAERLLREADGLRLPAWPLSPSEYQASIAEAAQRLHELARMLERAARELGE